MYIIRDDTFWKENRLESLNKDEKGFIKCWTPLKTVKKFKQLIQFGQYFIFRLY